MGCFGSTLSDLENFFSWCYIWKFTIWTVLHVLMIENQPLGVLIASNMASAECLFHAIWHHMHARPTSLESCVALFWPTNGKPKPSQQHVVSLSLPANFTPCRQHLVRTIEIYERMPGSVKFGLPHTIVVSLSSSVWTNPCCLEWAVLPQSPYHCLAPILMLVYCTSQGFLPWKSAVQILGLLRGWQVPCRRTPCWCPFKSTHHIPQQCSQVNWVKRWERCLRTMRYSSKESRYCGLKWWWSRRWFIIWASE